VATAAKNINFGLLLTGAGTAWFDSLAVEVDGLPWTSPAISTDFESDTPKGFYTGGDGYTVELDKTVSHTGRQSLRMVLDQ
jgi:hypothetical protein